LQKTKIEWVKNPDGTQGFTSNPIKGYCPVACFYCYSRQHYDRFGWDKTIRFDKAEMHRLYSRQKPAGIFIGSMHEIFLDKYIEDGWTGQIIEYARVNPWHRIYLLTKQPQNLIKFSPFPENCWVGVTATNADMLFDALNHLDDIQCKVRYVSIEPMLGDCHLVDLAAHLGSTLDWVIIGAQTKPLKLPKLEWVTEIIEACAKAGVKVFLKNNLLPLFPTHQELNHPLRQEMPE